MAARAHQPMDDGDLEGIEWPEGVDVVTHEEWLEMLDHDTREELGMSLEEFIAAYRSGALRDHDRHAFIESIAMMLPAGE